MKLYLMRHCLTDDGPRNDAGRTLDDVGRQQAHIMKRFLKRVSVNPDLVICSDYVRAHDTAKVVNRGVEIKTTPLLRPDATLKEAWKGITKLAGASESVLVVTHGPLIEPLFASVAFAFHDRFHWEHGSIGYVNTHQARFRWFVTPKLAAHIVGEDPAEVENPAKEAWARAAIALAENLRRAHKAAVVEPLVDKLKEALRRRWSRQRNRLVKTLPDLKPLIEEGNLAHVITMLQAALPLADDRFQKTYRQVTQAAYAAGAQHVHAQIGHVLKEAAKKKPPIGGTAVDFSGQPDDDVEQFEDRADDTTGDRLQSALEDVKPFEYAAVVAGVRGVLNGFSDPADDKTSRGETAALTVVSNFYHDGGADMASNVADASGQEVEKH